MSIPSHTGPLWASHTRPGRKNQSTSGASRRIVELLLAELWRLEEIRAAMTTEGLDEEAGSLETTIADLQWQYEELDRRWSDGSEDNT